MSALFSKFFPRSLTARLFAGFMLVALLSLGGLGLAAYRDQRNALTDQVTQQLTSIAELKEQEIEAWLSERRADTLLLAINRLNQDHLTAILDPATPNGQRTEFAEFMRDNLVGVMNSRPGYTEISIVDSLGEVVIATDSMLVGRQTVHDIAYAGIFDNPHIPYIQDIHIDPNTGLTSMAFGHTIRSIDLDSGNEQSHYLGAVIIIVDMERTIYPLVGAWPGLGETGETLLVRAEGNQTLFLNNLRFNENAALNLNIANSSANAQAAQLSAQGEEGVLQSLDYRGQDVLAAYRHIDGLGWGFVAKKDVSEAFAPVTSLTRRFIILALISLTFTGFLSIALSRTLIQPLSQLVSASRTVAAGDLSTKIDVSRADEIGHLADAFKSMVGSLEYRQQQMDTSSYILRSLNATPFVIDAFHKIAPEFRAVVGCETISLYLLNDKRTHYRLAMSAHPLNVPHIGEEISLEDSNVTHNILAGRTHFSPDLTIEMATSFEQNMVKQGYRSRLALPLRVEGQVNGMLDLAWSEANHYSPENTIIVQQVADALASALERFRLFRETQQRAERLEALVGLSTALRPLVTIEEIVKVILERTIAVVGGSYSNMFLVETEGESLTSVGCYPDFPDSQALRHEWGEGVTGHVAATGEVYISENLREDEQVHLLPAETPSLWRLRSSISVPLHVDDRVIGVLHVGMSQKQAVTPEQQFLMTAIADIAGNAVYRAGILEQLEKRVAERTSELAEANERLQELDKLKSKFVSNVSHELRSPIASMTLAADLWERTPPEHHPKYRDVIKRQTKRLGQLVEDILDLSRLEMGKTKGVELEPVDFNLMVEQSVIAHVPRAEHAGLQLTMHLDPELPEVQGVFNQLSQVVTNLVANAINYTETGSIAVRTGFNPQTNQICLEVKDTGFGILPEDIPHLFDRFYRGQKSVEADIPGTGLGLGIAKEIIELHNGKIEVASEVGVGSTFWVHLPAG